MADTLTELEGLLERLARGDVAARDEMFVRTEHRLRILASRLLHGKFAKLADSYQTDDVMQNLYIRLLKGWELIAVDLTTGVQVELPAFLGRICRLLREVMLDMLRTVIGRSKNRPVMTPSDHLPELVSDTWNPEKLAVLTELHQAILELPERLRIVVDLRFYQEMTHAEIGRLLGISESGARERWVEARMLFIKRFGHNPFLMFDEC